MKAYKYQAKCSVYFYVLQIVWHVLLNGIIDCYLCDQNWHRKLSFNVEAQW